jgi:hypothetical protein
MEMKLGMCMVPRQVLKQRQVQLLKCPHCRTNNEIGQLSWSTYIAGEIAVEVCYICKGKLYPDKKGEVV